MEQATRIGGLVVHGVGEQQPNEQRDEVAAALVSAWQKRYGRSNVSQLCDPDDDLPKASNKKVSITIRCPDTKERVGFKKVYFKEVYWADLDENPQSSSQKIRYRLAFWRWALSQWMVKRYPKTVEEFKAKDHMELPLPEPKERISFPVRTKLFGVGISFILLGVTWELLRFLVRVLHIAMPGSGVLVQYLADISLYTENRYRFRPPHVVLTDAPRDAIRRRMVRGLVDMAEGNYDRWYVVAHSLGSVVAHNGLMEPAEALPNYLSHKDWQRVTELQSQGPNVSDRKMRPVRPCWLADTDALDRGKLFANLKGFFTYGSPLSKFAALWPAIVPVNKDMESLGKCEWINVRDRMDSISGPLNTFGEPNKGTFAPRNVLYRSSWLFLLAHIRYLRHSLSSTSLADVLGEWILKGQSFREELPNRFGGGTARAVARYAWWLLLSGLVLYPLAYLASMVCGNCVDFIGLLFQVAYDLIFGFIQKLFSTKQFWGAVCVLAVAVAVLVIVPIASCVRSKMASRKSDSTVQK